MINWIIDDPGAPATPVWGVVGPRGSQLFNDPVHGTWEWARCHQADCPHFVCRHLSSTWCWQHADRRPSLADFIKRMQTGPDATRVWQPQTRVRYFRDSETSIGGIILSHSGICPEDKRPLYFVDLGWQIGRVEVCGSVLVLEDNST